MKTDIDKSLKQVLDSRAKLQRLIQQTEAQKKLVQAQEEALAVLLVAKPQASASSSLVHEP